MTATSFSIFFDEGAGYLFVRDIGDPTQGEVQLVRCVADGQLYVRDEEIRFYRPHPNIPVLVDWTMQLEVDPDEGHTCTSTASIWQLCNGTDLEELMNITYEDDDQGLLPEPLIWKVLETLLTLLDFLHFSCQPAIGHYDVKTRNVFVHWEEHALLPTFKLGDFGCSHSYNTQLAGFDFQYLSELIDSLINEVPKHRRDSYSQELTQAFLNIQAMCKSIWRHTDLVPSELRNLRQFRPLLNTHLHSVQRQARIALLSISENDREQLYNLRPKAAQNAPYMCQSTQELYSTYSRPQAPCQIVEIDVETFDIIRVVGDAYEQPKPSTNAVPGSPEEAVMETESPVGIRVESADSWPSYRRTETS